MTNKRKIIIGLTLAVAMALGFATILQGAVTDRQNYEICNNGIDDDGDGDIDETTKGGCYLDDEVGSPTSAGGVVPEEWTDNPSCADIGYGFGFKIEAQGGAAYTGTFTFTNANGVLTGGASEDPGNSVTLVSDGYYLDWTSTIPLDAVIMKGGPNSNVYIYDPEASSDDDLAPPNDPGDDALSHVEFCFDYELDVSKTAETTFTRTYDWEITKEADATYNLFAGDTQDHKYLVSVLKDAGTDSAWAVSGTITIENNTPSTATITDVSDSLSGVLIDPTVNCGVTFPYDLVAGDTLVCTYSKDLPNGNNRTNTATVTTSGPILGGEATADVIFGEPTTKVNDSVDVTDTNAAFGGPYSVSDDTAFDAYEIEFACDADEGSHENTAKVIGDGDVVLDSDTATVTINCYDLTVTKDATTSLTRTFDWTITKEADATYNLFAGDTQDHKYMVSVLKDDGTDSNWAVSGNITVSNAGNPIPAEITGVSDVISGVGAASVSCGVTFPHTIAAGGSLNCTYSAALPDASDRTNTATATLQNYDYASDDTAAKGGTTDYSGNADVLFDENTVITKVNDSVDVTDTNAAFGGPYSVSDDTAFDAYEIEFACDADEGSHENTAKVIGDGDVVLDSDTATVTINCYDLTVTKDADGTYDERHTWDIEKSVTDDVSGYPGDTLEWTWTVTLSESSVDENFALTDTILISNVGNPISAKIKSVADVVSDDDGVETDVNASVTCDETLPYTIPAGGTLECSYEAGTDDLRAYETNTATATLQNFDYASDGTATAGGTTNYSGTADVSYTKTVINGSAVVVDDQEPDFDPDGLTVYAGGGSWEWTETQSIDCSRDWTDYDASGQDTDTLYNTAKVTGSDGQYDESSADVTWLCKAGTFDLLKLTQGIADDNPANTWSFALFYGPDGFGTTPIATDSVPPLALMDFGMPALRPDTTYTVCEYDVAAGWSSEWSIGGVGVIPYNPNADDDTPEDLGNRCFDFGAGTAYPVTVGATLHFEVDNTFPGGNPRTPGYWKNWSSCTGGGQYAKTTDDVDPLNEFISLDEVLGSPGVTWDDILDDEFLVPIDTCEVAVDILDKREVGDPEIVKDGKKKASDPLHNLATHLLAAQLNFGAGACTTQEVLDAALAAETLLDEYNFDGLGYDGKLNKKSADAQLANELADYLDRYNNGEFCGDFSD
jgi:hypothetical protein